ncbi:MAG: DMT family transporter [Burkholderiales bacterium]
MEWRLDAVSGSATRQSAVVMATLLVGAAVWGLVWYPYRALEIAGFSSTASTVISYAISLLLGVSLFGPRAAELTRHWRAALAIAITAGWTNLAYVLAMVDGEVMRVLLLFYLAPLWTVGFARVLLGERLTRSSALLVLLSLAGALVMLWPDHGWPLPANAAEWIGLSAGVSFALLNVLSLGAEVLTVEAKSTAIWLGVLLVSAFWLGFGGGVWAMPTSLVLADWLVLVLLGVVMFAISLIIQYGVARVPANTAIVVFLVELVAGAISSALLSDEVLTTREWLGGAMIVSASLVAAVRARS